jgi:hypothetical protein
MRSELPDLYTLDDLLERYRHLSRDTLYDVLGSGELRGFKIGRVWHIDPDDWTAFLERRKLDRRRDDVADAPTASTRRRRAS